MTRVSATGEATSDSKTTAVADVDFDSARSADDYDKDYYESAEVDFSAFTTNKTLPKLNAEEAMIRAKSFGSDYRELVATSFRENGYDGGSYYSNEIARELSSDFFKAGQTKAPDVEPQQPKQTFAEQLEGRYSQRTKLVTPEHSVKLDYLDFGSVETSTILPTLYIERFRTLSDQYKTTLTLLKSISSDKLTEIISGLFDVAEIFFTNKIIDEDHFAELQTTLTEANVYASLLDEKYSGIATAPIEELLKVYSKINSIKIGDVSFLNAASHYLSKLIDNSKVALDGYLRDSGLTRWYEEQFINNGELPPDLVWRANTAFGSPAADRLFRTLTGSPTRVIMIDSLVTIDQDRDIEQRTPQGQVINPFPLATEFSLSYALPNRSAPVPDNAESIIKYYSSVLDQKFKDKALELSHGIANQPVSIAFYGLSVKLGTNQEINPDLESHEAPMDQFIVPSDRESIFEICQTRKQKLAHAQVSIEARVDELGLLSEASVSSVITECIADIDGTDWFQSLPSEQQDENNYDQKRIITNLKAVFTQYLVGIFSKTDFYNSLGLCLNELGEYIARGNHSSVENPIVCVINPLNDFATKYSLVLSGQRKKIDSCARGYSFYSTFIENYDELTTCLTLIASGNQYKNLIDANIKESIKITDEVFDRALHVVALPKEYNSALKAWSACDDFIQQSAVLTGRMTGHNNLGLLLKNYLEQSASTATLHNELPGHLNNISDAVALADYAHWLNSQVSELENSALDFLRDEYAEEFVNRLRLFAIFINRKAEELDHHASKNTQDIDTVIENDFHSWAESLPSGWPTEDGGSSIYANFDRTMLPNKDLYLDQNEFLKCLKLEDSSLDAFHTILRLNDFIANYEEGYFLFFCIPGTMRNEEEAAIKTIRDHDAFSKLLLILADISKQAKARAENTTDGNLCKRLRDIAMVCDQTIINVKESLSKQPEKALWVFNHNNKTAISYQDVITNEPTETPWNDTEEHCLRAQHHILQASQNPVAPDWTDAIHSGTASDWIRSNPDIIDPSWTSPEMETTERILQALPAHEKHDFLTPVLNGLGLYNAYYYLGRLSERFEASASSVDLARRQFIKSVLRGSGDALLSSLASISSDELPKSTDILQLIDAEMSSQEHSALRDLSLTAAELIWVAGYIGNLLWTQKYVSLYPSFSDCINLQEQKITEIDTHIDSMSLAEANELHAAIEAKIGRKTVRINSASKDVASGLQELRQIKTSYDAKQKQRDDYDTSLALLDPENPKGIKQNFTPAQLAYAVAYYACRYKKTFSEQDLEQFKKIIISTDNTDTTKAARVVVDRLSPNARELFYMSYYSSFGQFYYASFVSGADDDLMENHRNLPENFYVLLSHIFSSPETYLDRIKLVHTLDESLASIFGEGEVLDAYQQHCIRTLLDQVRGELWQKESSTKECQLSTIFSNIEKALLDTYNMDSKAERAIHSKYNGNGYTLQQFQRPRVGIERILSVENLKAQMKKARITLPDNRKLRSAIDEVFQGILHYFADHSDFVVYDTDDGVMNLKGDKIYVIIKNDRYELTPDLWLIPEDTTKPHLRLSENCVAKKIYIEAANAMALEDDPLHENISHPSHATMVGFYALMEAHMKKMAAEDRIRDFTEALTQAEAIKTVLPYFNELIVEILSLKGMNPKIIPYLTKDALQGELLDIREALTSALHNESEAA